MDQKRIICDKVSKENINLAIEIQHTIFPKENDALNLKASADKSLITEVYGNNFRKSVDFWICKDENNIPIGITGIYSYFEYPDDAWCGWYGILPQYQGMGYGKELLLWTMAKAKEMGYKNFRLYTDLIDNQVAVDLYRKIGMIEESYVAEDMGNEKTMIFSKSLTSSVTKKFGNKKLFLKKQAEVQNRSKQLSSQ